LFNPPPTRFLNVDPSFPRHKGEELNKKILANDDLRTHEILHCYTGMGIPGVGKISRKTETKSVITLNAYNSICPKNNVLYFGKYPCSSRGLAKCSACTAHSNLSEFIPKISISEVISAGNSQTNMFRDIKIASKCERNLDYINAFHVYGDHVESIYDDFDYPTEKFYKVPIPKNNIFDSDMSTRSSNGFKALFVGRLSRDKGVDKLPDILRILH
jgi:glycosyltransferase involved in cell wall biosynthesis